jgi:hypothetical protein
LHDSILIAFCIGTTCSVTFVIRSLSNQYCILMINNTNSIKKQNRIDNSLKQESISSTFYTYFVQKFVQSQTVSREKLLNLLSYKKCMRKMLTKLRPEKFANNKKWVRMTQHKMGHPWHSGWCSGSISVFTYSKLYQPSIFPVPLDQSWTNCVPQAFSSNSNVN